MVSNTIDAGMMAKLFLAGAKNLESKKEWINEFSLCRTVIPVRI